MVDLSNLRLFGINILKSLQYNALSLIKFLSKPLLDNASSTFMQQNPLNSKFENDQVERAILPPADYVLELLELDADVLRLIEPFSKRQQYRAVINWVTKYKCPQEINDNLEVVKGYLEAFYHLCEVGDWERAKRILDIKVPPVGEDLDTQLERWGYYEELILLYSRLLGKLDQHWDSICLNGLGLAYYFQGEYHKAIKYHQQHLQIARKIGDRCGVGRAVGNLGVA